MSCMTSHSLRVGLPLHSLHDHYTFESDGRITGSVTSEFSVTISWRRSSYSVHSITDDFLALRESSILLRDFGPCAPSLDHQHNAAVERPSQYTMFCCIHLKSAAVFPLDAVPLWTGTLNQQQIGAANVHDVSRLDDNDEGISLYKADWPKWKHCTSSWVAADNADIRSKLNKTVKTIELLDGQRAFSPTTLHVDTVDNVGVLRRRRWFTVIASSP